MTAKKAKALSQEQVDREAMKALQWHFPGHEVESWANPDKDGPLCVVRISFDANGKGNGVQRGGATIADAAEWLRENRNAIQI